MKKNEWTNEWMKKGTSLFSSSSSYPCIIFKFKQMFIGCFIGGKEFYLISGESNDKQNQSRERDY